MIKDYLKKLNFPQKDSHKGQNGRLLIIGGSKLFHAASLWSLKVASRIVDLVHYSSVEENNIIVQKLKEEFRDGIIVPRSHIEDYINEDDCILIGPGMVRTETSNIQVQMSNQIQSLKDIEKIGDEGVQTYFLTKYLLQKYPHKKWVIDAGALQMLDLALIPKNAILTPHHKEFELLCLKSKIPNLNDKTIQSEDKVKLFAKEFHCTVLLKGEKDIACCGGECDSSTDSDYVNVCVPGECEVIEGGNPGMTKGGTGDVLAGLTGALYCVNDSFTSAVVASYINKKAGDDLFTKMGYWFNASDLAEQIPITMRKLLLDK